MTIKEMVLPPLVTLAIAIITWVVSTVQVTAQRVDMWEVWKNDHDNITQLMVKQNTAIKRKIDCIVYVDTNETDKLYSCLDRAKGDL